MFLQRHQELGDFNSEKPMDQTSTAFDRRRFLQLSALASSSVWLGNWGANLAAQQSRPLYQISLAQWSLHRAFFSKQYDPLDFAQVAKTEFGIDAIEYVNQFFFDKARNREYVGELRKRAEDQGVRSLLIMVDREGALGDADPGKRRQAVENHKKWVEAAAELGCHSIRVNAASSGTFEEQVAYAADGLSELTQFADQHNNLNVIVENHGGLSSHGGWLSRVMETVDHPHCGTLPDFGNFRVHGENWYDRYQGVEELMPYAKAVSAKSHRFDEHGNETSTDYRRMMQIVVDAGYRGYVGIEYEGSDLDELEGIRRTKALLERVRKELGQGNV